MSDNTFKYTQRARAIIIAADKILLIKRIKTEASYWVIPGGGIEEGETLEQGLTRECFEELGVNVQVKELFVQLISTHPKSSGQEEYFYLCEIISGQVGTGQGPEFQDHSGTHGQYLVNWVSLPDIAAIDLRPLELKNMLLAQFCLAN